MEAKKGCPPFQLLAVGFKNGDQLPAELAYASPALVWTGQPPGTESFALVMEEIDIPGGKETKVHWLVYGFGPDASSVHADLPHRMLLADGLRQGRNDFADFGYTGPTPRKGASHRYSFKLYALPSKLILKAGATKKEFWDAMNEAAPLAHTELIGLFKSVAAAPQKAVADDEELSELQKQRLDYLKIDNEYRKGIEQLEDYLKALYDGNSASVEDFFHKFSFTSPFAERRVREYLDTLTVRDLRPFFENYIKFANRFRIQLKLTARPLGFRPVPWVPYGEKFHVRIVEDHLEPVTPGPISDDEPLRDSFESSLKVSASMQKLIDDGIARFIKIEDGPGYSLMKDLELIGYTVEGVVFFFHNAEQPYLGCIFGEHMDKEKLGKLGSAITDFQKEYYGRGGGRPKKTKTVVDAQTQQSPSNDEDAVESKDSASAEEKPEPAIPSSAADKKPA